MKEGWTYKKLGEVCEVTDYVANGSFATLRENVTYYNEPNYAILVRLADYSSNFDKSKFVYVDEHSYNFLSKSKLYGGEIIMSNVGSVGKCFVCPDLGQPMTIGPNSILVRTPNSQYFYYYFQSESFQNKLRTITNKATLAKFNKTQFRDIEIIIPSSSEQQRIVSRLDAAFAHIDELKTNAEKQLSEARALFQKALTKAMKPKEGWEEKKMGDVCEVNRGRSKHRPRNDKRLYGGNYPFIQTGDIHNAHGGILKSYSQTYSDFGLAQSRLWKKGTICITIAANIGETAILGMDACFPDSVVGIYPNEVLLNAHFLNYYLVSIKESIDKLSYGTAQKNINLEILNNLLVYLPPLSEQQRIVSRLDSLSAHIRELEEVTQKTIAECDALKQALLRKVFE